MRAATELLAPRQNARPPRKDSRRLAVPPSLTASGRRPECPALFDAVDPEDHRVAGGVVIEAMRQRARKGEAVALVQPVGALADLKHQAAVQDDADLLTRVGVLFVAGAATGPDRHDESPV